MGLGGEVRGFYFKKIYSSCLHVCLFVLLACALACLHIIAQAETIETRDGSATSNTEQGMSCLFSVPLNNNRHPQPDFSPKPSCPLSR